MCNLSVNYFNFGTAIQFQSEVSGTFALSAHCAHSTAPCSTTSWPISDLTSAVPATKSALRGSPSAVPATKSALTGSPNAGPATKSALGGSPSAVPATILRSIAIILEQPYVPCGLVFQGAIPLNKNQWCSLASSICSCVFLSTWRYRWPGPWWIVSSWTAGPKAQWALEGSSGFRPERLDEAPRLPEWNPGASRAASRRDATPEFADHSLHESPCNPWDVRRPDIYDSYHLTH